MLRRLCTERPKDWDRSDSNVSIDNNTPKKNLKYLSGDRKDTGECTVIVANKHGSDDANIEVVVLGKLEG